MGPAFDTSTWTAGKLGTSFENAIYTKEGLTLPVETMDKMEITYYSLASTSNTTKTVTISQSENAVVSVYQSNGTLVNATSGANGTQKVSFSVKRNQTYYIQITGDTFCNFTVN